MAKKSVSKVKENDVLMIITSRNVRWAVAGKCGCGYKLTPLNRSCSAVSFVAWSVVDYLSKAGYHGLVEIVKLFGRMYKSRSLSRSTFYEVLFELLANSFGYVAAPNCRVIINVTQNFHYYKIF